MPPLIEMFVLMNGIKHVVSQWSNYSYILKIRSGPENNVKFALDDRRDEEPDIGPGEVVSTEEKQKCTKS